MTAMTLIEVLLALMILSVALVVYLTALQATNQANQKAGNIATATLAAEDEITLVEAANTSLLTLGTTTTSVTSLPSGSMTVVITGIANTGDTNPNHAALKEVDVTVTWSGAIYAPSMAGSVTLSTYVCTKR